MYRTPTTDMLVLTDAESNGGVVVLGDSTSPTEDWVVSRGGVYAIESMYFNALSSADNTIYAAAETAYARLATAGSSLSSPGEAASVASFAARSSFASKFVDFAAGLPGGGLSNAAPAEGQITERAITETAEVPVGGRLVRVKSGTLSSKTVGNATVHLHRGSFRNPTTPVDDPIALNPKTIDPFSPIKPAGSVGFKPLPFPVAPTAGSPIAPGAGGLAPGGAVIDPGVPPVGAEGCGACGVCGVCGACVPESVLLAAIAFVSFTSVG